MDQLTPWAALAHLIRPHRLRVLAMSLVLAIAGAIPLVGPLIVATFIDAVISGEPRNRLTVLAALYVGLGVVRQIFSVAVAWSATDLAWRVTNELRSALTRHVLRLDLSFHRSTSPGALVSRVDDDVTKMNEFVAYFAVNAIASAFTMAGLVLVVALRDWRIGLGLAVYLAVALGTVFLLRNRAVGDAATEQASSSRLYGEIEERLGGADDLRSNGGGSHAIATLQRASGDLLAAMLRREREGVTMWVIANAVFLVGGLAMLALDSILLRRGSITLGTAYLLFQYTQILRQPLEKLADETQRVQQAAGGMARTIELLGERSTIIDDGTDPLPDGPLGLELDGVGFTYDDEDDLTPVLSDIDLRLAPGETLGVLGRTGSGKTTLARLLLRLIEPTSGAVRLGGVALDDVALADLRARTGVVSQEVHLFGASIRDNLTLFDDTVGDETVRTALSELDLLGWVEAMPDGLDTVLGPAGEGLSAGESQLIALTRLFLRSPDFVLLDEASSRIDPDTEARVTRAVDRLLDGRTAVVIAHRLTTVERLDRMLVLDAGRIVEEGPTAELRADPASRYAELLALGADTAEMVSAP